MDHHLLVQTHVDDLRRDAARYRVAAAARPRLTDHGPALLASLREATARSAALGTGLLTGLRADLARRASAPAPRRLERAQACCA